MSDIVEKFDTVREMMMRKLYRHRSYKAVFGTDEGREVLRDIMKAGYVNTTTFVAGDPEQTVLNEGSRRLALSILRMATMNHDEQIRLIEKELEI